MCIWRKKSVFKIWHRIIQVLYSLCSIVVPKRDWNKKGTFYFQWYEWGKFCVVCPEVLNIVNRKCIVTYAVLVETYVYPFLIALVIVCISTGSSSVWNVFVPASMTFFSITASKQGVKRRNASSSSDSGSSSDRSTSSVKGQSHSHRIDKHRHKKKKIPGSHKKYRILIPFLFNFLLFSCWGFSVRVTHLWQLGWAIHIVSHILHCKMQMQSLRC